MSRIKILPEVVASQIAAGEVVSRPASAVKELIDNSLDAGASRITVSVEKGGNHSIRVEDDGCGMSEEELPIALRRHATSKIESESDLLSISTHGFRGEALAAIASVSHVEIISRPHGEKRGKRLLAIGGEVSTIEPVATPPGTSVLITDLFFNTPVRKKFLKSPTTEMDRTSETVLRTAISYPGIHFELLHNGKKARHLPPVPSTIDRLVQIWSSGLAEELLPVDYANDRMQITGFTSRPTTHRKSTSDIYFYVNNRFVRDRILLRALSEAYRASLPQRRYPVVVLFLSLPSEDVDVNVHPAKEEIRFRNERMVWSCVYAALRESLSGEADKTWVAAAPDEPAFSDSSVNSVPSPQSPTSQSRLQSPEPAQQHALATATLPTPPAELQKATAIINPIPVETLAPPSPIPLPRDVEPVRAPLSAASQHQSEWHVVAQLFNSYIVCESGDEMAVFDQHALHERLQFERFRAEWEKGGVTRQRLMFPTSLEIAPQRSGLLADSLPLLSKLGFEIDPFGENTFAVQAIPADLELSDVKGVIEDALDDLSAAGTVAPMSDHAEKILARMSCRSAIKAGDKLDRPEMQELIDRYSGDVNLATCPHGRPPIWRITRRELEKWFDRP